MSTTGQMTKDVEERRPKHAELMRAVQGIGEVVDELFLFVGQVGNETPPSPEETEFGASNLAEVLTGAPTELDRQRARISMAIADLRGMLI